MFFVASYLVFVLTSTFIPSNINKLIHLKMMSPQRDLPDLQVSQLFVFGSVELHDFYSSLSGNSNPTSSPGTFLLFLLGAFCDGILAIIAFWSQIKVAFTLQQQNRIEQRYRTPSPSGHLKQYARHSFAGKISEITEVGTSWDHWKQNPTGPNTAICPDFQVPIGSYETNLFDIATNLPWKSTTFGISGQNYHSRESYVFFGVPPTRFISWNVRRVRGSSKKSEAGSIDLLRCTARFGETKIF